MNKKIKWLLALGATLFIASIIWLFYFFPISSLCLSPDKYLSISTKSAIFSPNGSDIAFGKWERVFQHSRGICAFPDGGPGRTVVEQVSIYKNAVDTPNTPTLLSVIPIPKGYSANDGYKLLGWDEKGIYLSLYLTSTKGDMSHKETYYRIDPNIKNFFELKKSEIDSIKTKFSKEEVNFYPKDRTMWLLNKEKNGLGLYTQEGGTRYPIGSWPQIFKKLIVSDEILYRSSFSYNYKETYTSYCANGDLW